jgi:hypothetical protein
MHTPDPPAQTSAILHTHHGDRERERERERARASEHLGAAGLQVSRAPPWLQRPPPLSPQDVLRAPPAGERGARTPDSTPVCAEVSAFTRDAAHLRTGSRQARAYRAGERLGARPDAGVSGWACGNDSPRRLVDRRRQLRQRRGLCHGARQAQQHEPSAQQRTLPRIARRARGGAALVGLHTSPLPLVVRGDFDQ